VLIDESFGPTGRGYQLTRVHRLGRHTVRVRVTRDFYQFQSLAVAEVLTPALTWTPLAGQPPCLAPGHPERVGVTRAAGPDRRRAARTGTGDPNRLADHKPPTHQRGAPPADDGRRLAPASSCPDPARHTTKERATPRSPGARPRRSRRRAATQPDPPGPARPCRKGRKS